MSGRKETEAGFVRLIGEQEGILRKICRMYGRSSDERADLFQEMVLQLWRAFPTFRQQSKASTFIYRVALNTAISYNRKECRHRSPDVEIPDLPEEGMEERDQLRLLYLHINQLDRLDRALIFLHLEGYRYHEISELSGLTETNVGTRISRIKKQLTEKIKLVL